MRSGSSKTMVAKSYRLLRAILNTAVVEDELIVANPCKIKGAGEERADERPALTIPQRRESNPHSQLGNVTQAPRSCGCGLDLRGST
jgi:hypothetical protein